MLEEEDARLPTWELSTAVNMPEKSQSPRARARTMATTRSSPVGMSMMGSKLPCMAMCT